MKRLDYRALHPLFHFERFSVNGNPSADGARSELWTANAAGQLAMQQLPVLLELAPLATVTTRPRHECEFSVRKSFQNCSLGVLFAAPQ